jgi:hypothetical protein
MMRWMTAGLAALSFVLAGSVPSAHAQLSVSVGVAPVCPYGYFDYAPYDCAPYGYYGPDWFVGGVFIGAGPWFHGPKGFAGHVDNRYDPHHGYKGPVPQKGEEAFNHFHGNEARDGHGGVVAHPPHEATNEHAAGYAKPAHGGGGEHH